MNEDIRHAVLRDKYLSRLAAFEKYYFRLVALCAAGIVVAIALSILVHVLIGIAAAAAITFAYIHFSKREAKAALGVTFVNTDGAVIITGISPIYDGAAVIPECLIYADVREIGERCLTECPTELYIPKSIEKIGKDAIPCCEDMSVLYEGDEESWKRIVSLTDLSSLNIHYNCDFPKLPPKEKKAKKTKTEDMP